MCLRFCSLLKIGGKEFKDHTSSDKLTKNAFNFPNSLILGSYFKKKEKKSVVYLGEKRENKGTIIFPHRFQFFSNALMGNIKIKQILR